jgi:hypothetical protein
VDDDRGEIVQRSVFDHAYPATRILWAPEPASREKDLLQRGEPMKTLVALRDLAQGETLEYAYQVKLKGQHDHEQLVKALETLQGIQGLSLLIESAHTEL